MGPLMSGFFFFSLNTSTTVLHDSRLAESTGVEPWIWRKNTHIQRADYKLQADFQLSEGSVPLTPALFKGLLHLTSLSLSLLILKTGLFASHRAAVIIKEVRLVQSFRGTPGTEQVLNILCSLPSPAVPHTSLSAASLTLLTCILSYLSWFWVSWLCPISLALLI